MIWAGTGVIWTLSGGGPKSSQLLGIGVDLAFNSIDAQREACVAYFKSQACSAC
jgi:hypothetical protein